ncbi:flagellar hook-associated protein FlgK [Geobacter grbiciae]|uniref:flagellar hook-associated protein FlgK n=1 Tax=Geobacter grbiciae TaxID=155042 RepID=UPI001C0370AB|nr:flagellar hook-associated protein FlgK [Geobacter grbiciae]MBT1075251.1 flagellar hook-associated protein FlgK [Geobacter grbiciae]
MSIQSILDIGKSSLIAQRLALEVTSENITNVNTPGYSRQTTVLATGITTMERGFPMGTGVKVADIQRAYDAFLQSQLSKENTDNGFGTAVLSSMKRTEQLFNDLTTDGLGKAMQNFFNAWQDLTANPQGQPERQAVLSMGQQLVDQFQRINGYLNDVKNEANKSLEGLASDVNDKIGQIASLNDQIKQIEIQGGHANELRDQRDLLVRQLSSKVGITYVENGDGTLSVSLTLGQPLVIGDKAAKLSLEPDPGNSSYYKIMATSPGGNTAVDISTIAGGPGNAQGEMGGALQVRDTLINGFLSDLDELAYNLANEVNSVHSASYGLTGITGRNFFNPPAAMAGYSGKGGISLAISKTSDVAAADSNPLTGGTGNNKSASSIASIYDKVLATSGGNLTLEGFFNSLVGKVGVSVQDATRRADQSGGIVKQLDNLRESNSGVSLDEELANLVKYQKAYEGAAKLINVGSDMMDTILGLIR